MEARDLNADSTTERETTIHEIAHNVKKIKICIQVSLLIELCFDLTKNSADEQLMIVTILINCLLVSVMVLLGEITCRSLKTGVHDCYLQFDIS